MAVASGLSALAPFTSFAISTRRSSSLACSRTGVPFARTEFIASVMSWPFRSRIRSFATEFSSITSGYLPMSDRTAPRLSTVPAPQRALMASFMAEMASLMSCGRLSVSPDSTALAILLLVWLNVDLPFCTALFTIAVMRRCVRGLPEVTEPSAPISKSPVLRTSRPRMLSSLAMKSAEK